MEELEARKKAEKGSNFQERPEKSTPAKSGKRKSEEVVSPTGHTSDLKANKGENTCSNLSKLRLSSGPLIPVLEPTGVKTRR